jgi:hypothetical protein
MCRPYNVLCYSCRRNKIRTQQRMCRPAMQRGLGAMTPEELQNHYAEQAMDFLPDQASNNPTQLCRECRARAAERERLWG